MVEEEEETLGAVVAPAAPAAAAAAAAVAPVGRLIRWWLWKRFRRTGLAAVPEGAREGGGRDVIMILGVVEAGEGKPWDNLLQGAGCLLLTSGCSECSGWFLYVSPEEVVR